MPPTTAPDDPLAEWHDMQPCERIEAVADVNITHDQETQEVKEASNHS